MTLMICYFMFLFPGLFLNSPCLVSLISGRLSVTLSLLAALPSTSCPSASRASRTIRTPRTRGTTPASASTRRTAASRTSSCRGATTSNLYHVLVKNKTTLPEEALYMVRFHSFYPWHRGGEYMHLTNNKDQEMLKWVLKFKWVEITSTNMAEVSCRDANFQEISWNEENSDRKKELQETIKQFIKKGGKRFEKGKCIKLPLLQYQNGDLFRTLVFSQVF